MSIFTKEQQDEKAKLQQQIAGCTDDVQAMEIMKQLLDLNRKQQDAINNRPSAVAGVFKQVGELEIQFNEFMEKSVFSIEVVKAYAVAQEWVTAPKPAKGGTTTQVVEAPAEKLIVGTFQFADYGFTMPNKKSTTVPMGNGDTSLEWDFNKRYGGPSWQQKFINAIIAKGYQDVISKITPEFKAWLETSELGKGGPKNGIPIFKNKRDFLKAFDIKPAQADDIAFNFPEEKIVEAVVVKDEFSQETPAEAEVEVPAKKKKH
jgi:hypothetical protein